MLFRSLQDSLQAAMANGAQEVRRADWQKQSWLARVASWLAFSLVRLLIGLSGYTQKEPPAHPGE